MNNDTTANGSHIELTAEIVSAYVSNNTVAASDIPALINQVHAALARVSGDGGEAAAEPLKPAVSVKKSITPEHIVCLEDGKKIQVAQASIANAIQHDAGAVPGQMEPAGRLSDGGAQLRGRPLAIGQADGSWSAAPSARQVAAIPWLKSPKIFSTRSCF